MSDDNNTSVSPGASRARRSSITSNTFTALFGRSNSMSSGTSGTAAQPSAVPSAQTTPGRRMSITTLGLLGTSPMQGSTFGMPGVRRGSVSTAGSESIDENAIDDDESPNRSQPTSPHARRMSFGAQALLAARGGGSPGASGRSPPYNTSTPLAPISDQKENSKEQASTQQASMQSKPRTTSDYPTTRSAAEGLNWSEQFRSRAESALQRPSFSTSPSSAKSPMAAMANDRSKSISEMPAPPASIPAPLVPIPAALKRKPDAVGERILRGDFHMD